MTDRTACCIYDFRALHRMMFTVGEDIYMCELVSRVN